MGNQFRAAESAANSDSTDDRVKFYVGVDGGGTGCRARLTDAAGRTLGEGRAGPANLGLGLDAAVDAVMQAVGQALVGAGLDERALHLTVAGLGMAAANVPAYKRALERAALPFRAIEVCSDAEAACLGAHGGRDGGVLILGTGSQGVVRTGGRFDTVGGWGFELSDFGSGAILGREAVRRAMLTHEGVEPATRMTQEIMARFASDARTAFEWASRARPREWAEFARTVFDHAEQGDSTARELVHANAAAVEHLLDRMVQMGAERIALMGGVARPTRAYLSPRFDALIVEPEGDAMDGALLLARS